MALIEIVSDPDMRSPKEARRYLDKLRNIVEYLDIFDGDLEGALRVGCQHFDHGRPAR